MNFGDDLYREIILENYKSTKNRRALDDPAFHQEGVNPSCGDDIELYIRSDGEQITDVSYEGMGCSICLASANMLCDAIKGMKVSEAEALIDRVKGMLVRNETPDFPDGAEDLEAIQGVANYPVRVKCALLSWNTLHQILEEIRAQSA
ncbi:MAG: Fe-S cluster assembly sulfur transfer protein SufU [Spirochaetota bacterium]